MTFQSLRFHAFYWAKIYTLIKTRRNRKCKILHTVLARWTLCFSSYKNCELKVKLWWVGAHERIKRAFLFFVTFILSEGNLFNICFLSQCIVYWINFQNIYTFAYQKALHHTLLLVVFKIIKSLYPYGNLNWSGMGRG